MADTQGGMLGFAVAPAGDRVVFGGPLDGLFMGPTDGSSPPSKLSDAIVTCLRWSTDGLYVCSVEPEAPYSLGLAPEPTEPPVPLWRTVHTCRGACPESASLEATCSEPWERVAPLVGAEGPTCDARPGADDGGSDVGATGLEAGVVAGDAAGGPLDSSSGGCAVGAPAVGARSWPGLALLLCGLLRRRRSGAQRHSASF